MPIDLTGRRGKVAAGQQTGGGYVGRLAQRAVAPAEALARIQADLANLAATIAAELARPALARDAARVQAAMAGMDALRPRLLRAVRVLAALLDGEDAAAPRPSDGSLVRRQHLRQMRRDGRFQLGRWDAIRTCVLEQIPGDPRPLVPRRLPRHHPLAAQLAVSDAAFLAMHAMANPNAQSAEAKAHGCYPDIRMPPSRFLELAHAAYRLVLARRGAGPFRFLDVGCGGGVKVLLAAGFFDAADGLEYDPGYAAAARDLFAATAATRCRAIRGDALAFRDYGDYDVVYFFQPMSDRDNLRAMEDRIVPQVRPGTVLIAPYQAFLLRSDELGCPLVARSVHIAGVAPGEAAAMLDEAERIGTAVVRGRGGDARLGFWSPVVAASRANGFDPLQ